MPDVIFSKAVNTLSLNIHEPRCLGNVRLSQRLWNCVSEAELCTFQGRGKLVPGLIFTQHLTAGPLPFWAHNLLFTSESLGWSSKASPSPKTGLWDLIVEQEFNSWAPLMIFQFTHIFLCGNLLSYFFLWWVQSHLKGLIFLPASVMGSWTFLSGLPIIHYSLSSIFPWLISWFFFITVRLEFSLSRWYISTKLFLNSVWKPCRSSFFCFIFFPYPGSWHKERTH